MKKEQALCYLSLSIIVIIIAFCYQVPIFNCSLPIDANRVASFATTLSALFTGIGLFYLYSQIEELKKQRTENNKPSVFVLEQVFDLPQKSDSIYSMSKYYVEIVNAGKFHAFNIKYEWEFDKKKVASYLKSNGYECSENGIPPLTFSKPIKYSDDSFNKDKSGAFPFVISNLDTRVKIFLPYYLMSFIIEYHNKINKTLLNGENEDTDGNKIFESISLYLTYKDINQETYKIKYKFHSIGNLRDKIQFSPLVLNNTKT